MPASQMTRRFEIDLIDGLDRFVENELTSELGRRGFRLADQPNAGRMSIEYSGTVQPLLNLQSAVAVHLVEHFAVPRPKALLGHQHFNRLLGAIREVVSVHPPKTFKRFRISAAGSDSGTFRRLRADLSAELGLEDRPDEGHLHLTVRRAASGLGWEVLIRLMPLPLSARAWRVCNRPDALNATIAHSMVRLAGPRNQERFLNLCCGSGALLVERMRLGPATYAIGIDADPEALNCAERNMEAAGVQREVKLIRGDARRVPLPAGSFDTIVADLPFGLLSDTSHALDTMYADTVQEAARLLAPGGSFVIITVRRRLLETALGQSDGNWNREGDFPLRISHSGGYIKPIIFVLHRS